jgi:hypothetical protein
MEFVLTQFTENLQPLTVTYILLESVTINAKICMGEIFRHFNQHSITLCYCMEQELEMCAFQLETKSASLIILSLYRALQEILTNS